MPHAIVVPVLNARVRKLCYQRYPGHPNGCPNYGKRANCPPRAPMLHHILDLTEPVWAIWNAFDLGAHARRMAKKHPDWTLRQIYCCLYWQGAARSALRGGIGDALTEHGEHLCVVARPEAHGINVTATMKKIGIELEWPPRKIAYQVALLGTAVKGLDPIVRQQIGEF